MAEIVELRLERGLSELLELETTGLFTKDEIKTIVTKREHFEYKLQRMVRKKEDYLKYITYEMSLLQLVRLRRKKTSGSSQGSRIASNAEKAIGKRIAAIYRSLVYKYPSDLSLWLSYLDFCQSMEWRGTVSGIYGQILQRHPHQEHLWIAAAKYELEVNLTVEPARQILQRALRINDKSPLIWREYFKLEVMYADKIYARKCIILNGSSNKELSKNDFNDIDELDDASSDAILSGKIAEIVFQSAMKATTDASLGIELFKILEKCECPQLKKLQDFLIFQLKELCPSSELVISNCIQYSCRQLIESKNPSDVCAAISTKYEEAVEAIATTLMWDSYLTFQLQVVLSCLNIKTRRKQVMKLDFLFEKAWSLDLLSESMMQEWLLLHRSLLDGSSSKSKNERWKRMDEVVYKLTEKTNHCKPSVWLVCMQSIINTSGFTNDYIHKFFKRAMDKIHRQFNSSLSECNNPLPREEVDAIYYLVKIYLEWSIDLLTQKRILTIIESLVKGNTITAVTSNSITLNSRFKVLLIQLANKLAGVSSSYEYFVKYADTPPVSREMFDEMLAIAANSKFERKVIEWYISQESISSNNVEIWLKYVQLLIDERDMQNVANVYRKALKMLTPEKVTLFMEKYALFKLEQI